MSFQKAQRAELPQQGESLMCVAHGCPRHGSVRKEGFSGWACSIHAFVDPKSWPQVTDAFRDHDYIFGLIVDLRKMQADKECKSMDEWREYATKFWKDHDPHCFPADGEALQSYINRMQDEFIWRAGAGKRPSPRVSPCLMKDAPKPKKRFSGDLGGVAA